MADTISDWTDEHRDPENPQVTQERITTLHNRLTDAIRKNEEKLRGLNQQALDMQKRIARMRDTADKLHVLSLTEQDLQTVQELDEGVQAEATPE